MTLSQILSNFTAHMADAVMVGFKPNDGPPKVFHVNQRFERLFGLKLADVVNGPAAIVTHPEVALKLYRDVSDQLSAGNDTVFAEVECGRADGSTFWAALSVYSAAAENGRFTTVVIRDIDQMKRLEREARSARHDRDRLHSETNALQTRLMAAINAIAEPLAIWDADYRLVICNDAFAPRITGSDWDIPKGTPLEDVLARASQSGVFVEADEREEDWLRDAIADIKSGPIHHTTHYTDGKIFQAVSHNAPNGDTLIISTDITELEQQRARLEDYAKELESLHQDSFRMARIDVVTGLGNRRFLEEQIVQMKDDRAANGGEIAALHIDLDRFKHINDTMGHAAGDFVLRCVAQRLRMHLRSDDQIARAGGDEFVVLTRHIETEAQLEAMARRLLSDLCKNIEFEGKECRFGASIGIARTPIVPECDLLAHSDIALYKAKQAGRGCVRSFRSADLEALKTKKTLADDILRGVEEQQFYPVYQPQIESATGKVVALEALARWDHPSHGMVSPAMFHEPATELGICDQIDAQVFELAVRECNEAFKERPDPPALSFNVGTRRLLACQDWCTDDAARSYPGDINIELLESIFMDDERPDFVRALEALRAEGFGIEVDDFGTGRASIVALQKIGPDRLKIDRALIGPIITSESSLALVRSIIDIGKTLGIGVTAEGVETSDHVRLLQKLGCDRLQGFHFARPGSLADLGLLPERRRNLSVA